MLDLNLNADGIIMLKSTGMLTIADVEQYGADLMRTKAEARRRFGRVRMFVDSGEAQVQPGPVIDAFENVPHVADQPGDRLAIFVTSSLKRMQMKRVLQNERERTFDSVEAAMDWLRED